MPPHVPQLICVTGGAASGKSTFANLLAGVIDAEVFSADKAVHELLFGDAEVIAAVREKFPGAWKDGLLDRSELGRIVFRDSPSRQFLEDLLHPRVYDLCDLAWAKARNREKNLVAEIPLLFESKAGDRFPFVILVAASRAIQLQRLQVLRKIESSRAEAMLAAQWPNEKKIPGADIVIWNDGSPHLLEDQAREVAMRIFQVE